MCLICIMCIMCVICITCSETVVRVLCCGIPNITSTIMCPPADTKAIKAADDVESKGVHDERYDVLKLFAIARMLHSD